MSITETQRRALRALASCQDAEMHVHGRHAVVIHEWATGIALLDETKYRDAAALFEAGFIEACRHFPMVYRITDEGRQALEESTTHA